MREDHSAVDKTANVIRNLLSVVGIVVWVGRGFNYAINSGMAVNN
jgi:hypothetical protein